MLVVVRANRDFVREVSFVVHGWCSRNGQVSEARLGCTFSADDAACLTLIGAVIQLRCSEIVLLGCGLLSCVVCGVSSMDYGFWQSSYIRIVFLYYKCTLYSVKLRIRTLGPHKALGGERKGKVRGSHCLLREFSF